MNKPPISGDYHKTDKGWIPYNENNKLPFPPKDADNSSK